MENNNIFYGVEPSYSDEQKVRICGNPRVLGDKLVKGWEGDVERQINEKIEDKKLRKMRPDEECNLFVTFYIDKDKYSGESLPCVDDLLKPLCDALKKWNKNDDSKEYLMEDDIQIRGIRAERKVADGGLDAEGVDIQYVITKIFKIVDVKTIPVEEIEKGINFWKTMQFITARQIINRKEAEPYKFIDNAPGQLFLAKPEDINAKFIPPGYKWKKGEIAGGCMVFEKEVEKRKEDEQTTEEPFFWLTKW